MQIIAVFPAIKAVTYKTKNAKQRTNQNVEQNFQKVNTQPETPPIAKNAILLLYSHCTRKRAVKQIPNVPKNAKL